MNEVKKYQQQLVDQLKAQNCITTPQIEQAFLTVPRHLFLPAGEGDTDGSGASRGAVPGAGGGVTGGEQLVDKYLWS